MSHHFIHVETYYVLQKLAAEERKKYDDGFQNNAFNQYASDLISVHRTLPSNIDEELVFCFNCM